MKVISSELSRFGDGTDLYDVSKFFVLAVLCSAFAEMLMDRFTLRDNLNDTFVLKVVVFYAQFGMLVIPSLVALTIWPELMDVMIGVVLILCILIRLIIKLNYDDDELRRKPGSDYFSYYRAMLQILTAIAILAVDFPVFPRKFAKTKEIGVSVMDTGTGMFVFAMGYGHAMFSGDEFLSWLLKLLLNLVFTSALGVAKPFLVALTGHNHEVSEYGVHWNFFITLSALIVFSLLPGFLRLICAVTMTIGIMFTPYLQGLILTDARSTLSMFEMNKEGIISLVGYMLIYELSTRFGDEMKHKYGKNSSWAGVVFCLTTAAACFGMWHIGDSHLEMYTSRRFANFSYCLLSVGQNTFCLGLAMFVDLFMYPRAPKLAVKSFTEQFGRNSIKTFLFANLLTFQVNRTFMTDRVKDDILSCSILLLYMNILAVLVYVDWCGMWRSIWGGRPRFLKRKTA